MTLDFCEAWYRREELNPIVEPAPIESGISAKPNSFFVIPASIDPANNPEVEPNKVLKKGSSEKTMGK